MKTWLGCGFQQYRIPGSVSILMIKAGAAVEEQAVLLESNLGRDDILIDAGNANFHDTGRRCAGWTEKIWRFAASGYPAASKAPAMARRSWPAALKTLGSA
jgi:6-phosphogluconate dehydrogenase